MKVLPILVGFFICLSNSCPIVCGQKQSKLSENEWQSVIKTKLCHIAVEKKLYRINGCPQAFYVHVRTTNDSHKLIGLKYSGRFVFPNQWGTCNKDESEGIFDGSHSLKPKLNKKVIADLQTSYKARKLYMIDPGESFYYFIDFNASGPKAVERRIEQYRAPFIRISMDSCDCFATDGTIIEPLWSAQGDWVVIPTPVAWQEIPKPPTILIKDVGIISGYSNR